MCVQMWAGVYIFISCFHTHVLSSLSNSILPCVVEHCMFHLSNVLISHVLLFIHVHVSTHTHMHTQTFIYFFCDNCKYSVKERTASKNQPYGSYIVIWMHLHFIEHTIDLERVFIKKKKIQQIVQVRIHLIYVLLLNRLLASMHFTESKFLAICFIYSFVCMFVLSFACLHVVIFWMIFLSSYFCWVYLSLYTFNF